MNRLFLIVAVILLILNCYEKKRNSDIIVDAFPGIPFNFKRPILAVPDSLGGERLEGNIVTKLEIDSCGIILDFKVMFMNITDGTGRINIKYRYTENKLDENMIKFNRWVEQYINKLVITKSSDFEEIAKLEKYSLLFPIEFGNKD